MRPRGIKSKGMVFTEDGKELVMGRIKFKASEVRLGNWVWWNLYLVRLLPGHLQKKGDRISPLEITEEALDYLPCLPDGPGYWGMMNMDWGLLREGKEWYLCYKKEKLPLPVRYAHQVQNVIYYWTGEEI